MSEDEIVRDHVHERKLFLQLLWKRQINQNYYRNVKPQ